MLDDQIIIRPRLRPPHPLFGRIDRSRAAAPSRHERKRTPTTDLDAAAASGSPAIIENDGVSQ
jgi:hypothetical protein